MSGGLEPVRPGFIPDGVDDWADAFQAYVDVHGELPDLPAGRYRISRTIVVLDGGGGTCCPGPSSGGPR